MPRAVSVDALESLTSRAAALVRGAHHPMVERAVEAAVRLERAIDATFERLWTKVSETTVRHRGTADVPYHEAGIARTPWARRDRLSILRRSAG